MDLGIALIIAGVSFLVGVISEIGFIHQWISPLEDKLDQLMARFPENKEESQSKNCDTQKETK